MSQYLDDGVVERAEPHLPDVVPADDEKVYQRGKQWETDRESVLEFLKALGWRLFYGSLVVIAVLVVLVAVLVMRHRPLGFLVTVDKASGETSTVLPLDETTFNLNEIEVKHDVKRYIEAREGYYYPLLQRDYDLVMSMSCDDVFAEYNKQFDGDKGLDKVLGGGTQWRVDVRSVRLPKDEPGKAVVSFEKTVWHGVVRDEAVPPARYVVTMTYKNEPSMKAKEAEWIENPRGFKACAYRRDSDDLGGGAK